MTGMTSIRGVVVAAALGMMLLAPQAVAAQQMIDGSDPDQILNLARGYGSANLEKSDNGDPLIRGRIDGVGYAIFFNDCTNNRDCDTLGFYAGWTDTNVTGAHVAEWNRSKRFSRAYIDDEGDPVLEFDVNLKGGVSRRNFDDTLDWWKTVMLDFRDQVINPN
ncbi:YbjN domain-containing protein [Tistrella mobilis]|jgi:hypothetical protein|uniref:YbjN domain-containing protein n=1 Tax=Tistrella mobilis TaxID=171437 RepID=UPI003556DEDC